MPQKATVDKLLAESFKELVAVIPVEKITIKEITDKAGVIRPTFYNHFQDKYELLEWIIRTEILDPILPLLQGGFIREGFTLAFQNAEKDKEFYKRVCKMEGQNSFRMIIEHCIKELLYEFMKEQVGENARLHNWMTSEYLAEYYAQSMSYVLQRWLESDLVLPASEVANLYYYILNNSMEEILAKMR